MTRDDPVVPATPQAAQDGPADDRKDWQDGLAPAYILLFSLIVYYDQLAPQTLAIGGLGWSLLGAAAAGLLAFGLLYYVPAMWGLRARQPLESLAASTFGARGAAWVPGLVLGLAQVVWFAVVVGHAADVAMRGLVACRLLDAKALLQPSHVGGMTLGSPLYLFVTLNWALFAALVGIHVPRLVAAVMKGYAAFPALVLGLAMLWALPGLAGFRPLTIDPVTAMPVRDGRLPAFLTMIQLIFGFFATSGAASADWGAACRDARDVRLGGLVGVAMAAMILATIPLITIAGAQGRMPAPPGLATRHLAQERLEALYARKPASPAIEAARAEVRAIGAENFTYRGVLQLGIGGYAGGVMLLVLGLPLLGPTCYAPFLFGHRFAAIWPGLKRWAWSLLGGLAAWPLIATGAVMRLGPIFTLLGAAAAPIVGALAADYLRCRGAWPGPRRGINPAGLIAWAVGFAVGLIPLVNPARLGRFQPAAVFAFAAAMIAYLMLAAIGLEPPAVEPAREEAPATEPAPVT